jgi:plastocyanin
VTVQDLDAAQIETATLKLASTANGTLSNLAGGSYDAATGIYTLSGTAAAVKAALDGLIFTPTEHQVAPGSTVQTGFSLAVTDGIMDAAATYHVAVAAVNDPPTISGGGTQPDAYWNVPFAPFTGMTIADPDVGASETVTIGIGSPDYFALGTLALAQPVDGVSLTQTGTGVYQLTAGSPAAVTAALDAVTFTPSTTNPALGFTISYLTVSVADGIAPPVTAPWIEVSAGLPIITGTVAGQTVVDTATIDPFSKVTITDSAAFTSEAITITVENTLGAATDANGKLSGTGLTKIGVGTYALPAGTPAAVSAALDALVFTPTPHQVQAGQSVTSTFVLSVFDGATTSDNYDTTVIATAPASAATASAFLMPTGREWLARAGLSARDLGAGLLGGGRSQWENWHASGVSARGAEGFGAAASLATAGAKDAGPGVYPTGEPFGR